MSSSQVKQPWESRLYDISFAPLLGTGETVTAVVEVLQEVWDSDTDEYVTTTDLTFGTPATDGTLVQVRISGGLDQKTYKVTFRVNTSLSNQLEGEGILVVEDI